MSKMEAIKNTFSHILSREIHDQMYCGRCHQVTEHVEERSFNLYGGYAFPRKYRCRICGMGRQSW